MRMGKDIGAALGLLAGTTFGSGISFLMRMEHTSTMLAVTLCGLLGAAAGITVSLRLNRRQPETHPSK
ncbi:hypothetical protein Q5741_06410 [Paenibacillus sp. JX-17]|uniref:Uncharacterized protein n=1 Tax=Paenibacillus lacisoli TaxID=3064525 RepID=A0ABT9C9X2_9BACL|nr:hypothetical protein [Paenibacillus sp. JX-17]MDO7906051.1 hypothetical protein [Paenibacillus sp. JX-17]